MSLSKANSYDPSATASMRSLQSKLTKLKLTPKTSIDRVHHPKFLYHLNDKKGIINEPLVFEARVEKIYTIDKVTWYHNDQVLTENVEEDIKILQTSTKDSASAYTVLTLVFGRFQAKYCGTITVIIENQYGKTPSKCQCSINFDEKSDLVEEDFIGETTTTRHFVSGHRKLSNTAKVSSNNARLYNLDENATVDSVDQQHNVKCQGYTSDVMTALEEEDNIKNFQPKHRLSQTQQYLNGFLEK